VLSAEFGVRFPLRASLASSVNLRVTAGQDGGQVVMMPCLRPQAGLPPYAKAPAGQDGLTWSGWVLLNLKP